MLNTGGSRPTLRRRLVSESEADPLNSTINPRNNSGMNFPSDRAESNPNITGFIDESPYTGPGVRLQSQWEGNETYTENFFFDCKSILMNGKLLLNLKHIFLL